MVKLLIDINPDDGKLNLWVDNDPVPDVININLSASEDDYGIVYTCSFTTTQLVDGQLININYCACDKDTETTLTSDILKNIKGFLGIPITSSEI